MQLDASLRFEDEELTIFRRPNETNQSRKFSAPLAALFSQRIDAIQFDV